MDPSCPSTVEFVPDTEQGILTYLQNQLKLFKKEYIEHKLQKFRKSLATPEEKYKIRFKEDFIEIRKSVCDGLQKMLWDLHEKDNKKDYLLKCFQWYHKVRCSDPNFRAAKIIKKTQAICLKVGSREKTMEKYESRNSSARESKTTKFENFIKLKKTEIKARKRRVNVLIKLDTKTRTIPLPEPPKKSLQVLIKKNLLDPKKPKNKEESTKINAQSISESFLRKFLLEKARSVNPQQIKKKNPIILKTKKNHLKRQNELRKSILESKKRVEDIKRRNQVLERQKLHKLARSQLQSRAPSAFSLSAEEFEKKNKKFMSKMMGNTIKL
ncbi:unnamed protein product [Moneuplotes crassus]|uniref:Uncharacterized protein n=1 Tax=Euplotes crassus TaxID=5936 RepID=A0AAD1UCY9_EUPCR|nr:unnamed protein product [Moneuplotes crassus]